MSQPVRGSSQSPTHTDGRATAAAVVSATGTSTAVVPAAPLQAPWPHVEAIHERRSDNEEADSSTDEDVEAHVVSDVEDDDDAQQRHHGRSPIVFSTTAAHRSAAAGAGAASPPVQYDAHDHTVAAAPASPGASLTRRLWVLPRRLLPPHRAATHTPSNSTAASAHPSVRHAPHESAAVELDGAMGRTACASTRTSTQSTASAAGGAGGLAQDGLRASVLRLPHPRHGEPFLCLVAHDPPASDGAVSSSVLYEVQAQAPPSGFAQSWFVGEEVFPSTMHDGELLLATPMDLTYLALHELVGDAQRYGQLAGAFRSAEDLYRSGGAALASTTTGAAAPVADGHVSAFAGVGDGSQSSSSSSSTGPLNSASALHFGGGRSDATAEREWHSSRRAAAGPPAPPLHPGQRGRAVGGGGDGVWSGWARAAAAHPLLLQRCLDALQSEEVLRRLCECRGIGMTTTMTTSSSGSSNMTAVGSADVDVDTHTMYYRPSEAVAVAWLRRRVERVRASAVLRSMLQLPVTDGGAAAEVPMAFAFGVVAEYVPERLHAALAAACGLVDPATSTTVAEGVPRPSLPPPPPPLQQQQQQRPDVAKAMDTVASVAAPKSASVKRLEKAGRPKGTPTLLAMFAKKARAEDGTR
ncbi:surface antigen protein 2 [Novymonas esmeraldas]|uniref:Surface antigen protein 2 n=1 Tax=Novymonas esmeraldas TaxID=1808958 RepID=A0AAW0F0V3_9TRYP